MTKTQNSDVLGGEQMRQEGVYSNYHKSALTLPLASTCSAANTTPPHRGQPWPAGALMMAVSITVILGASLKKTMIHFITDH